MKYPKMVAIIAYVAMSLFSFGDAVITFNGQVEQIGNRRGYPPPPDIVVARALLSGAFWPLYWSWKLQR